MQGFFRCISSLINFVFSSDMNQSRTLSLLLLLFFNQLRAQTTLFNVTDFGARNDGITLNTVAIQRAIDAASASGRGLVFIPRGRFLTGVIHLKSNVQLHLHEEAVLLATTDRMLYGPSLKASPWIVAENAHHVSITGKGMLDGQCDLLIEDIYKGLRAGTLQDPEWKRFNPWHQRRPVERNRPRMLEFRNCDSVTIRDVKMQNGTSWIQDYQSCTNLLIEGIQVLSNTFLNNDGIDLTDCRNAVVRNCTLNAADDGICLKSSLRNKGCENILIENCRVRSSASAVKFGTASHGGFRNITVRNIYVYDTYRSAIAIEAVDGGAIENVTISNITSVNTGNAFFIRLGHRNKDSVYSTLRNVTIRNMKAYVPKAKPDKGYFMEGPELLIASGDDPERIIAGTQKPVWHHYGIDSNAKKYAHNVFPSSVTGIPGHHVENVTLENIEVIYEGGSMVTENEVSLDRAEQIPEAIGDYPEFSMFGELPAWGMFARHVRGLSLKNVTFRTDKPDHRIPILLMDVEGLSTRKVRPSPVSR